MKTSKLALTLAFAVMAAAPATNAQPLGPGREAEVEALFAGVGSGETAEWVLGNVSILPDRIRAEIGSTPAGSIVVELRRRGSTDAPAGRTPSFDVIVLAALLVAGPMVAALVLCWDVFTPPPEPTFRLEYRFFREQLGRLPQGCRIVRTRIEGDLGLVPPEHLSRVLRRGDEWVDPFPALDPSAGCFVWWRPSACDAFEPGHRSAGPACRAIEERYRLEPLAVTTLPARAGFVERYRAAEVRVGFFRLR